MTEKWFLRERAEFATVVSRSIKETNKVLNLFKRNQDV
jgi:hypothetical protein